MRRKKRNGRNMSDELHTLKVTTKVKQQVDGLQLDLSKRMKKRLTQSQVIGFLVDDFRRRSS